ncbi:MAG TPA: DEAD/DEAH box helicase [Polyangiaceae bacterium]|jgi:ATP-dependent RNA helicase DeaD
METPDFSSLVGPALAGALEKRGFTALTAVQQAVLAPELAGRDLRVSSQTGSGKTVAIGLSIRDLVQEPSPGERGVARPRALVVVPTRELAKQVNEELTWLFAPFQARVASATGGSDYREERRAFSAAPVVVVGTPGRLLDHLNRGSIDATGIAAVVLDEADRMLDLGFREELESILGFAPEGHLTHLVSATFPGDVVALANRVQSDPMRIEATPLGTANADIDHLVHLVPQHERLAAIINLLLATPGAQTLVFARTRADVAEITSLLGDEGFEVRALSGEMEQGERNRALAAFKKGTLHALVATDVAARGIDVQDIARVIHAEPPTDADSYTHRSGRTGRAGKKGTSSVLASPAGLARVSQLLRRARVRFRVEPIPTAEQIRRAADDRFLADLVAADVEPAVETDARVQALAERLVAAGDVERTIARLVARTQHASGPQPREVTRLQAPAERPTPVRREHVEREHVAPRMPREPRDRDQPTEWVDFRFTWGSEHGADPRRLLAMACRRGAIRASDIGSIHVGRTHSIVQVAANVAEAFGQAAGQPDPRDPRVSIRRQVDHPAPPHAARPAHEAPRAHDARRPDRARPAEAPPRRAHSDAPPRRPHAPPPPHGRAAPPADRPSRARAAPPADRPSRGRAAPPADRPSRGGAAAPADRPSRGGQARPKRKHP